MLTRSILISNSFDRVIFFRSILIKFEMGIFENILLGPNLKRKSFRFLHSQKKSCNYDVRNICLNNLLLYFFKLDVF